MDKRYLIFVSSTFDDLQEERRKVMEQILNMGHLPVGMELFQASNSDQWDYISQRIAECDYYVLIVGERYGSEAKDGISYTEKEFDLAVELRIPVSAHLISASARETLPRSKVEFDKKDKVNAFRARCENGRVVKYWSHAYELANNVGQSLNELFRVYPRVGLVRGDQVTSPQLANELARLSEENAALRTRIAELGNNNEEYSAKNVRTYLSQSDLRLFYENFSVAIGAADPVPVLELILRLYKKYPNGLVFAQFCEEAEALVGRIQDGSGILYEPAFDLINKLEPLEVLFVHTRSGSRVSGVPSDIFFGRIGLEIAQSFYSPSDLLQPTPREAARLAEKTYFDENIQQDPIF